MKHGDDADSCVKEILDGLKVDIKEVPRTTVRVRCIPDAVELKIRVTKSGS